jgi:2-oxoglutarate dehydrogenase complex dehydrogenase (E1) component-like enzyme
VAQSTKKQENSILDTNRVINLIRSYQRLGHLKANLDPIEIPLQYKSLGMVDIEKKVVDRLTLKYHGFTDADLDKEFIIYTENVEVR